MNKIIQPNKSLNLISIIVPCYNEEKNIDRTFDEVLKLQSQQKYNFEIIAINDGSKDKTWDVIKKYAEKYKQIIGINQMANFGQSQAYQAGFDVAKGDYIILLSADLEIPIENINKVINFLDEGYDFVNTNRIARWNGVKGVSRKFKSGHANRITKLLTGLDIKDTGSGLKGMIAPIAKSFNLYGEMHRFLPQYASIYGAKIIEFDVEFKDRDYGKSAYKGQSRTLNVILDMVTLFFMLNFAKKPFYMMPGRLFGFTGLVTSAIGFLISAYLIYERLALGYSLGNRPLFVLSTMMFILGMVMIMFGVLGELLMRIYFESTGRKPYMVRKKVN